MSPPNSRTQLKIIQRYPLFVVASIVFTYFLLRFHFKYTHPTLMVTSDELLRIGGSAIAALSIVAVLDTGTRGVWLRRIAVGLVAFVTLVLYYFNYRMQHPLDFSVLYENIGLAAYAESWQLMGGSFKTKDYVQMALCLGLLFGADVRWQVIQRPMIRTTRNRCLIGGAALAWIGLWITQPLPSHEELTRFVQGGIRFAQGPAIALEQEWHNRPTYPYISHQLSAGTTTAATSRTTPAPNIIIVFIESFNANFAMTSTPDGQEYTPVFNRLARNNTYFTHFYGNSIQTAKGQFATLCGVAPAIRDKVFEEYADHRYYCLPEILRNHGYKTLFFKAYEHIDFDNTGEFTLRNGFDVSSGMDQSWLSDDDRNAKWGWGLPDDRFYRKVFAYVDDLTIPTDQPVLLTLTTVSNHMKFDQVPEDLQFLYPGTRNHRERYANSIHISDRYLQTFVDELQARERWRNSIVLILGDHSFPVGEHGNYYNEREAYEENFKTPLVWIDRRNATNAKTATATTIDAPYSQLNIAPSLLAAAGISTTHHFVADTLWDAPPASIPLIQPYSGTLAAIVQYPFKYTYDFGLRDERMINLATDPQEKIPLPLYHYPAQVSAMRYEIQRLLANDLLLRENRIWPE